MDNLFTGEHFVRAAVSQAYGGAMITACVPYAFSSQYASIDPTTLYNYMPFNDRTVYFGYLIQIPATAEGVYLVPVVRGVEIPYYFGILQNQALVFFDNLLDPPEIGVDATIQFIGWKITLDSVIAQPYTPETPPA